MGLRMTRDDGQEVEIEVARIIKLAWQDVSGREQKVEGQVYRARFEHEPEVEGHGYRFKFSDDQGNVHEIPGPLRVTYLDDEGQEQEVEGHAARVSDLRLKQSR